MLQILTKIVKRLSIPILLVAALFSSYEATYEPLVDCLVCLGGILFIQRSIWLREYSWGAGMVLVVVVFSPLFLATKVFLLMGLICMASLAAMFAALRREPEAAL